MDYFNGNKQTPKALKFFASSICTIYLLLNYNGYEKIYINQISVICRLVIEEMFWYMEIFNIKKE